MCDPCRPNPHARQVLSDRVAVIVGELLALDGPTLRPSTHQLIHAAIEIIESAEAVLFEAATMGSQADGEQGGYVRAMRRMAEALDGERSNG